MKIIIKIGTNLLTDHHQRLDLNNMRNIVYQIADEIMNNNHYEFIIVSSGAITSGAKHINISPDNLAEKQAAASIGQIFSFKNIMNFFKQKIYVLGNYLSPKIILIIPKKIKILSKQLPHCLKIKPFQ